MIETATPEQALLAWWLRRYERQWFIEPLIGNRLRLVMTDRDSDWLVMKVTVYMEVNRDGNGEVETKYAISDLIKNGLEQWRTKYRTLA